MPDPARTAESLRREAVRLLALHAALAGGAFGAVIVTAIVAWFPIVGDDEGDLSERTAELVGAGGSTLATTSLLCFLVVRHTLRPTPGALGIRAATMLAAILNAPIWLVLVLGVGWVADVALEGRTVDGGAVAMLGPAVLVFTFVSLIVTLPLGVCYAGVLGNVVEGLRVELASVTHRAPSVARDRGVSLLVVSIVLTTLVALTAHLPLVAVAPLLVGQALVLAESSLRLGLDRRRARRHLSELHAGRVPGLALVARVEARVDERLVPLAPIAEGEDVMAIVRTDIGSPYRALPPAIAIAPARTVSET